MNGVDAPENQPLLAYLRQQAQHNALIFSWCTGANVLAEAGLLDGRTATAHWGDIDRLERRYPAVQWQRGVRRAVLIGHTDCAGHGSDAAAASAMADGARRIRGMMPDGFGVAAFMYDVRTGALDPV